MSYTPRPTAWTAGLVLLAAFGLSTVSFAGSKDGLVASRVDNRKPASTHPGGSAHSGSRGEFVADRSAGGCSLDGFETFSSGDGGSIPDYDPVGLWLGPLTIPVALAPIDAVALEVTLDHSWVGDLTLELHYDVNGDGTPDMGPVAALCRPGLDGCDDGCCGCSGDISGVYYFADMGSDPLGEECVSDLSPGCYSAAIESDPFDLFRDAPRGGDFYLHVADHAGEDTGSISAWSVHISGIGSGAEAGFTDVTLPPLDDGRLGNNGVSWCDYDMDGDQDLFLTNEDPSSTNHLFRNDGAGTFSAVTGSGLEGPWKSFAAAWADYDNDGDPDVYVTNADEPNVLFRNEGGGVFAGQSGGALGDPGRSRGVSWVDHDLDGDLDLYVANENGANRLLRNDGSDVFVDATTGPEGDTLGSQAGVWGDYDNDGDPDLYITNAGSANRLLRNDGEGVLVDVTSGPLGDTGFSFGAAWGDHDNDGDLDLYVCNFLTASKLFRNDGAGSFAALTAGPLGDTGNDIGVAWADHDSDGDLDLYLTSENTGNRLLENVGSDTFVDSGTAPASNGGRSRGVAWGDFDDDGDVDLYLVNTDRASRLLRNESLVNHWLRVDLEGTESNRSGIGARVRVVAGGVSQIREIASGSGYLSQNSLTAEFGLGALTVVDSVIVHWPSGIVQKMTDLDVRQRAQIVEGTAEPRVHTIRDVGNDQGRRVEIAFAGSTHDAPTSSTPVVEYEVYRRIDPLSRTRGVTSEKGEAASPAMSAWDFVDAVPAHGDSEYALVVETLADSTTSTGLHWSVFFIRAATAAPFTFYDSAPDSGYSVDNLAPGVPANLRLAQPTVLVWDEAPEADFDFYTVYGSRNAGLDGTAIAIGRTVNATLSIAGHEYAHVTATDVAGNEGEAASMKLTSGIPGNSSPLPYALRAVRPNPFRSETLVEFDLPQAARVQLELFDVTGQRVRVVVDHRYGAGRHAASLRTYGAIAPGVYFLRLRASEFRDSRRVIVIE